MQRKLALLSIIFTLNFQAIGQDYSIIPTNLNAQGLPATMFLSRATIQNNSGSTIELFMKRIVKDLPPNWTSCFCYPECIAPFIDTLWIVISAYSSDSIMPNYATDTIPGLGTIEVELYQKGYESVIDTITFTGSTFSTGIHNYENDERITIYPNPFTNEITILNENGDNYSVAIYNIAGELVFSENDISGTTKNLSIGHLTNGVYFLVCRFSSGKTYSTPIIK